MTPPTDYAALRRLCEAARSLAWGDSITWAIMLGANRSEADDRALVEFLAAASPAVVLALLEERDDARKMAEFCQTIGWRVRPDEGGCGGETWKAFATNADMERLAALDEIARLEERYEGRQFPVNYFGQHGARNGPISVPWRWLVLHEGQVLANHYQSVEQLSQRGGLSPLELYMVVHGKDWSGDVSSVETALTWLRSEPWNLDAARRDRGEEGGGELPVV